MPVRKEMSEGRRDGKRKVAHPAKVQFGRKLSEVPVPEGLGTEEELTQEFLGYIDVLLGRVDSPIESPYLGKMEVAAAYHTRAREVEMRILHAERTGKLPKDGPYTKFRTGSLRAFIEMAKREFELGSRRLSQEDLITRQRLEYGDQL
jgi:hypothetical protein